MASIRITTARRLRPDLSARQRGLRRAQSTVSPAPAPTFLRRNRGRLAICTAALVFGAMGGNFMTHVMAPPPMPEAGSREDNILIADLNKRIDEEFRVKVWRGKCLAVSKTLKGKQGGWVEVLPAPTVHERGLIAQMQGAKALGVERVFWDRDGDKLSAIVWFGGGISGWPGVTHGGAIAAVLEEKAVLAASLAEGRTAKTDEAAMSQRLPGVGNHAKVFAPTERHQDPTQLNLTYVKPTYANEFYVIRVSPSLPLDEDPAKIVPAEPRGGHDYDVVLETMDGKTTAKAKVKFAPSSTVPRVEAAVADTANASYAAFKEWMWPSRQKSSTG